MPAALTPAEPQMATRPVPDWFDADRADFMQSGVSISLGARDGSLRPSVTRGLGCRVLPDGEVRVYVDASLSQDLLRDVAQTGQVAVVFSDIVRHRTLQVKAADSRVEDFVRRSIAASFAAGVPQRKAKSFWARFGKRD